MRDNRGENIAAPSDRVNRPNAARWLCVVSVAAVFAALKLLLQSGVELGKDEAAYWFWSQHLDASFALAPFAAIAAGDALWPGAEWALRLPSILLGLAACVLLYALCRRRALSPAEALIATAAFGTSHWAWHTSSYLHPDGFLVPAWLFALWCAHRAVERSSYATWMIAGAAAGLVCLTKLSGAALAAGLLLALALTPERTRRPRIAAALAASAVVVAPLLLAQWQTDLSVPSTLSTLSRVAEGMPLPLRLAYFLANPLLYVSPALLMVLYDAGLSQAIRAIRRRCPHDLIDVVPGLLLLGVFAFFALGRGQVKGNWILPAFLGVWPVAFAASGPIARWSPRFRRPLLVLLLALGVLQSGSIALALKHPGLLTLIAPVVGDSIQSSYPALISVADRPREPAATWSERLCEYHGWSGFARSLEADLDRADVAPTVPVVSGQYAIPFGLAFYGSRQRPVHTVDDPRFRYLVDLNPDRLPSEIVFVGRRPARPPEWLSRAYSPPLALPGVARQGPECGPERYELLWFGRAAR